MTFGFFLFYGLEVAVLGIYAILWQQVIKKFDLSIAYANKAMGILWSMIWAVLLFHNEITLQNIAGVALVVAGTIILNRDLKEEKHEYIDTDGYTWVLCTDDRIGSGSIRIPDPA